MTEPNDPTKGAPKDPDVPESGHMKIPLWIKLMWLGGMLWVLWYIIFGLRSTPTTWT
jgi:hypothetical protein